MVVTKPIKILKKQLKNENPNLKKVEEHFLKYKDIGWTIVETGVVVATNTKHPTYKAGPIQETTKTQKETPIKKPTTTEKDNMTEKKKWELLWKKMKEYNSKDKVTGTSYDDIKKKEGNNVEEKTWPVKITPYNGIKNEEGILITIFPYYMQMRSVFENLTNDLGMYPEFIKVENSKGGKMAIIEVGDFTDLVITYDNKDSEKIVGKIKQSFLKQKINNTKISGFLTKSTELPVRKMFPLMTEYGFTECEIGSKDSTININRSSEEGNEWVSYSIKGIAASDKANLEQITTAQVIKDILKFAEEGKNSYVKGAAAFYNEISGNNIVVLNNQKGIHSSMGYDGNGQLFNVKNKNEDVYNPFFKKNSDIKFINIDNQLLVGENGTTIWMKGDGINKNSIEKFYRNYFEETYTTGFTSRPNTQNKPSTKRITEYINPLFNESKNGDITLFGEGFREDYKTTSDAGIKFNKIQL